MHNTPGNSVATATLRQLKAKLCAVNEQIAAHENAQRREAISICQQLIAMHELKPTDLFSTKSRKY